MTLHGFSEHQMVDRRAHGSIQATNTTTFPLNPDPNRYKPSTVTGGLAFSIERSFRSGWFQKLGCSYGVNENTVDPGSMASGSCTGNAISLDPNNPAAGYSQFSPGPRVFGAVTYSRAGRRCRALVVPEASRQGQGRR